MAARKNYEWKKSKEKPRKLKKDIMEKISPSSAEENLQKGLTSKYPNKKKRRTNRNSWKKEYLSESHH